MMTLPDKLSVSRLYCTPIFFMIWFLSYQLEFYPRIGTVILVVLFSWAEISDALDGFIARKRNIISDFGKLLDPFSDVFLRLTYFLCFTMSGIMPVWTLAIILWRELGMLFVRIMLVQKGITLAANFGGKIKAILYFISGLGGIFYMVAVSFRLVPTLQPILRHGLFWMFNIAAIAALVSFIDYFRIFHAADSSNQ